MRNLGLRPQARTYEDVRAALLDLSGGRVRVDYSDGKYEVGIEGTLQRVGRTLILVRYLACDRTTRVCREGAEPWRPRNSRPVCETFRISDVLTGDVRVSGA